MSVLALGMMLLYSPLLSSVIAFTMIAFFAIRFALFPWYREKQSQGLHLAARVQSTFIETLRGARIFKTFGRERERISVWQNEQAAQINNTVEITRAAIWGGAGQSLLLGVQSIRDLVHGRQNDHRGSRHDPRHADRFPGLYLLVVHQRRRRPSSRSTSPWKTLDIHLERGFPTSRRPNRSVA